MRKFNNSADKAHGASTRRGARKASESHSATTSDQMLRKMGAFDRDRSWFRLPKWESVDG